MICFAIKAGVVHFTRCTVQVWYLEVLQFDCVFIPKLATEP